MHIFVAQLLFDKGLHIIQSALTTFSNFSSYSTFNKKSSTKFVYVCIDRMSFELFRHLSKNDGEVNNTKWTKMAYWGITNCSPFWNSSKVDTAWRSQNVDKVFENKALHVRSELISSHLNSRSKPSFVKTELLFAAVQIHHLSK